MPVYYLTTLPLDFTDYADVQMSMRRWLGVESSAYDEASIQVSTDGVTWVDVWVHDGGFVCDGSWLEETYDPLGRG